MNIYLTHFHVNSDFSQKGTFTIVPILVGALKPEDEERYGKLLSKYLLDPSNLFVISSDFCHWGVVTDGYFI
jgi:AmmeMemoRadiSam system protein B